jgi:alpha-glucosidase
LAIPGRFLEPGTSYTAAVYGDAHPEGGNPAQVKAERIPVDAITVLTADMAANGGHAIRIVPTGK